MSHHAQLPYCLLMVIVCLVLPAITLLGCCPFIYFHAIPVCLPSLDFKLHSDGSFCLCCLLLRLQSMPRTDTQYISTVGMKWPPEARVAGLGLCHLGKVFPSLMMAQHGAGHTEWRSLSLSRPATRHGSWGSEGGLSCVPVSCRATLHAPEGPAQQPRLFHAHL
jgi:hypothetical protein